MSAPALKAVTVAPASPGPVLRAPCPEELGAALEAGAAAMFVGASSLDGRGGEAAAAQNLHSAATWAASHAGVDILHLLPDDEELARLLRLDGVSLPAGRDLKTGKPLKLRRLVLFPTPNVILHLSTGSRTKLDHRTRSNPISDDIGETFYVNNARLLAVHEGTRVLRLPTAAAPISNAAWAMVQRHHVHPWVYFGDEEPPERWSEALEEKLWQVGKAGRKEVQHSRHRHSSGAMAKVGPRFVDGFVRYGVSRPSPAGTETALLRPHGVRGPAQQVCYIDEPASRPELSRVAAGRLVDHAIAGTPVVDQAALVCWFLRHFGKEGWGYEECADYLVGHGFRTPALYQHGDNPEGGYLRCTKQGQSLARNICRTILKDLVAYFSEQIVVARLNADGTDHVIHGFRPAGGPWLTVEDYDRIVAFLKQGRARPRNTAGYTFTGWRVRTPLGLGRLAAHVRRDGRVRYYVIELGSRRHLGSRTCRLPVIDHGVLAEAVAEGFIEHTEALLPLLTVGEAASEVDESRIQALVAQVAEQRAQEAGFELKWRYLTDGPSIQSAQRDYDNLIASREANEQQLRVLEARGRADSGPDLHGIPLGGLQRFVASLRNPRDVTFRAPFLDGALPLELCENAPGPDQRGGPTTPEWTWSTTVAFHDGDHSWTVPVVATTPGPQAGLTPNPCPDWVRGWVTQLRAGIPFAELPGSADRGRLPTLRRALGLPAGQHFQFSGEQDPRLLRIEMAVVHPAPKPSRRPRAGGAAVPATGILAGPPLTRGQLPALARQLNEPLGLLRAVYDEYVARPQSGRPRCLHIRNRCRARGYAEAGRSGTIRAVGTYRKLRESLVVGSFAGDWEIGPDTLRLRPCPHCGHRARVPLRIRVARGAVCGRCRRDGAGVEWPAVPYDRYRDGPP